MKISLFDYHLPEEKIAQHPAEKRDHSKLLLVDKQAKNEPIDYMFYNLPSLLSKGDVLVLNNTKVIPARLFGTKRGTGAAIELLLLSDVMNDTYEAMTKPAKRIQIGDIVDISDTFYLTCIDKRSDGIALYKLTYDGILMEQLEMLGKMPLPPYIKALNDDSRYQ
ncbi:MAG: S-adenosylmethionine:tRNA ribosyltransferase-isomerase, partial [Acholeplasmataceae bacterium]